MACAAPPRVTVTPAATSPEIVPETTRLPAIVERPGSDPPDPHPTPSADVIVAGSDVGGRDFAAGRAGLAWDSGLWDREAWQ